ncbi:MAG: exodeoxyribonuclease V alpha subunit [bacterium]|jgi:exodeoxyribonuclease V alpha subunit
MSQSFELQLNQIDYHFASFIHDLTHKKGKKRQPIFYLSVILSHYSNLGNVCFDLNLIHNRKVVFLQENSSENIEYYFDSPEKISSYLNSLDTIGGENDFKPIIYDQEEHRLYLHRYWKYEKGLLDWLESVQSIDKKIDEEKLKTGLTRFFNQESKEQQDAAENAVKQQFSIVSGGPGTGKTTTVVKILALLLEQDDQLEIALAAPTGKAAARLDESIQNAKNKLDCDSSIIEKIPQQSKTLHRLLGARMNSSKVYYNKEHQLSYDVIVIDEASMIPLALMAKLIFAIPSTTQLILLGDKEQLASVEAGSVLGDLCKFKDAPFLSLLEKSHRFSAQSGLGELSRLVNQQFGKDALQALKKGESGLKWKELIAVKSFQNKIQKILEPHIQALENSKTPEKAFSIFRSFCCLCAVRKGPYGVNWINQIALEKSSAIESNATFFHGMPIMVIRNNYQLNLYNGDVGIVLQAKDGNGKLTLKVFFERADCDGGFYQVSTNRLPEWEHVYAMTVHKSQGSEFEEVLFVLPEQGSQVITKELIYTGITRAKKKVQVWGNDDIFIHGCESPTRRLSGITEEKLKHISNPN